MFLSFLCVGFGLFLEILAIHGTGTRFQGFPFFLIAFLVLTF